MLIIAAGVFAIARTLEKEAMYKWIYHLIAFGLLGAASSDLIVKVF